MLGKSINRYGFDLVCMKLHIENIPFIKTCQFVLPKFLI